MVAKGTNFQTHNTPYYNKIFFDIMLITQRLTDRRAG